jgi:hypothetical protein
MIEVEAYHWKTREEVVFVVDDCDAWVLGYKWNYTDDGYVFRRTSKRRTDGCVAGVLKYVHREIMEADGTWQVDHMNGNTFDNRRANFLLVTPWEHHAERIESVRRLWTSQRALTGCRV